MCKIATASVAVFLGTIASTALAQAPQRCLEGRTATGACAHPGLTEDLRIGTVVFTQPKISLTNPPLLPYQDGAYYVPRDHHEISNLFGYPPVTSANGLVISGVTGRGGGPAYTGPVP
jgi:hypothetical protein